MQDAGLTHRIRKTRIGENQATRLHPREATANTPTERPTHTMRRALCMDELVGKLEAESTHLERAEVQRHRAVLDGQLGLLIL
jgi:hypothetical protein